jgi:hypothetical protein
MSQYYFATLVPKGEGYMGATPLYPSCKPKQFPPGGISLIDKDLSK